jgi:hypothetical protein
MALTASHVTDHHHAGVDTDPKGDADTTSALQVRVEFFEACENPETGTNGPVGIILMGGRITEIDEDAVAEILRDMPIEVLDYGARDLLVGLDQFAQILWIEPAR